MQPKVAWTMSVDGAEMMAGNDSKWHALAMLDDVGPGQMTTREVVTFISRFTTSEEKSSPPTTSAPMLTLKPDRFRLNQNRGSILCFDAFS
jgi:hypothetical protein